MTRLTPHSIVGLACAMVLGLAGSSSLVQALPCTSGLPRCTAAPNSVCSISNIQCTTTTDCIPGGGICMIRISGTAAANPNGVVTVALMPGSVNVGLTVTGIPPGPNANFDVFPTVAGADGQATLLATDTALQTCTVAVTFRNRAALPVANGEEICHHAEGYSFELEGSNPPSLSQIAGTTACSSHLATCLDNPRRPAGSDFLTDSRILGIRSPIAGASINMKLIRDGTYNGSMRLLFARLIDGPGFHDKTTSTAPGSTIIRGTGQWSDVSVVCGIPDPLPPLSTLPTLSGWGKILLTLLMLMALIWSSWRYGTNSNRVSRQP